MGIHGALDLKYFTELPVAVKTAGDFHKRK